MTKQTPTSIAEKHEAYSRGSGRNLRGKELGASNVTRRRDNDGPGSVPLMEAVVERENMFEALRQVERNKGSAGVDRMGIEQLRSYLKEQWPRIRQELLEGTYQPQAVRGVEIPKPGGKGMRKLGIPTVVDRLIQQALAQVLTPIFDPEFSEASYGFRPHRSAHQAVLKARRYVAEGRRWVVDLDLEKFFDRVQHDVLMARVKRRITDKRVLCVINRFLQAGVMQHGIVTARREGTPQGGPLSPLLSNILLDELDKELERRGHAHVRYADDCNVYVRSKRAGQRVMASLTRFLEKKLKLKVNAEKSAVDRPWERKFLGYSMTADKKRPKLRPAEASITRQKDKLKGIFRMARGWSLSRTIKTLTPIIRGWINYFRLSDVKVVFEELDGWVRHKLRSILWRQWKRRKRRALNLMKRGLKKEHAEKCARNGKGPWWNAGAGHMNSAFPKSYFDKLGLVSLLDQMHAFQMSTLGTAGYGTVRPVV